MEPFLLLMPSESGNNADRAGQASQAVIRLRRNPAALSREMPRDATLRVACARAKKEGNPIWSKWSANWADRGRALLDWPSTRVQTRSDVRRNAILLRRGSWTAVPPLSKPTLAAKIHQTRDIIFAKEKWRDKIIKEDWNCLRMLKYMYNERDSKMQKDLFD